MDKKQELIKEIEAAKKEFYAKNPCNHCVGNGCDDCRDCSEAELRHQLSEKVYILEKKFKQTYGEDYDAFKEKERNKQLNEEVKTDKIDLTKLTFDELCTLRADVNDRIFNLRKEDEEAKVQEFCKTLEVGSIYCTKNYYFYNDNTIYTIIKINGFEPNKEGKPYIQYSCYYVTSKPDKLSIKLDEMDVPVDVVGYMPVFRNPVAKDAETIFSEIENLYNRATTQLDVINTGIFEKTSKLLYEHCKNLKD